MNKRELLEYLKDFPDDFEIEVNDNLNGEVFPIEQVDLFSESFGDDFNLIMIQVNV